MTFVNVCDRIMNKVPQGKKEDVILETFDQTGQLIGYFLVLSDIKERKCDETHLCNIEVILLDQPERSTEGSSVFGCKINRMYSI